MTRPRHPEKEVEAVVAYAESKGWRWQAGAHWARMFCPRANRDGCRVSVFGTPRDAGDHAKDLRRQVDRCPHFQGVADDA